MASSLTKSPEESPKGGKPSFGKWLQSLQFSLAPLLWACGGAEGQGQGHTTKQQTKTTHLLEAGKERGGGGRETEGQIIPFNWISFPTPGDNLLEWFCLGLSPGSQLSESELRLENYGYWQSLVPHWSGIQFFTTIGQFSSARANE